VAIGRRPRSPSRYPRGVRAENPEGVDGDIAIEWGSDAMVELLSRLDLRYLATAGGVRPLVLERRAERLPYSKALTIYPRTVEQFAMRGLVDRWLAEGTPVPSSHFALMKNRLDLSFLPHPLSLHAVPAAAAHRGTARGAPRRARHHRRAAPAPPRPLMLLSSQEIPVTAVP
jgi:FAD binding domain